MQPVVQRRNLCLSENHGLVHKINRPQGFFLRAVMLSFVIP